ncbi:hypothetical protein GGS23DRAFT_608860 [Durotheca rogersii]|uniref:uncharacterized protein n=1 Tax=Durotheca rogersii TaxID=419775 RepID=UPI002220AC07|nr:uncharacterized protein GGS23DRAFT_608860 [Durotheca rogersii]KAI5868249.1 hypothetical protein GGS23DRAFT_608860 [Durotheca rogersii]
MVVLGDSQQKAAFSMCVISIPICILATILRFVATRRSGRRSGFEDWFALAALLTFLPLAVGLTYVVVKLGNRTTPMFLEALKGRDPEAVGFLKVIWINMSFFWPQQTFTKLSLLALYHRLFSVSHRFVVGIWIVTGLQIALGIGAYVTYFNTCRPVSKSWDIESGGTCFNNTIFFSIANPLNSLIDFVMAGQAVWMLKSLRLGANAKFKLALLFLLGGLSGAIGFVKLGLAQNAVNHDFRQAIFDEVQMATSVICCCGPLYKNLFSTNRHLVRALCSWVTRVQGTDADATDNPPGAYSPYRHRTPRMFSSANPPATLDKIRRDKWVNLDDSVLVWTNVEASRIDVEISHADQGLETPYEPGVGIPLRAVRVDRRIEIM